MEIGSLPPPLQSQRHLSAFFFCISPFNSKPLFSWLVLSRNILSTCQWFNTLFIIIMTRFLIEVTSFSTTVVIQRSLTTWRSLPANESLFHIWLFFQSPRRQFSLPLKVLKYPALPTLPFSKPCHFLLQIILDYCISYLIRYHVRISVVVMWEE